MRHTIYIRSVYTSFSKKRGALAPVAPLFLRPCLVSVPDPDTETKLVLFFNVLCYAIPLVLIILPMLICFPIMPDAKQSVYETVLTEEGPLLRTLYSYT